MRRVWVILASASLVAGWGCGNSYDIRMNKTLEDMKYRKRLDDLLMPPVTKNKFEELYIFVRPPKKLDLAKEFLLPLPDPGKFDLEASLLDTSKPGDAPMPTEAQPPGADARPAEPPKQSLHIVARVKRPKNPKATKKGPEPVRGDFNADLLALVNAAFAPPAEVTLDKFKPTTKRFNTFKQFAFTTGEKYVQVYFYTGIKDAPIVKNDPYEVALIFEYPRSEHNNLFGKIDLSLEAFAVGNRAKNAFSGGVGEPAAGAAAPAGPGAF